MNSSFFKSRALVVFGIVTITAIAGYQQNSNLYTEQAEMIRFTDLSEADIDLIMEVKAEMYAASVSSY